MSPWAHVCKFFRIFPFICTGYGQLSQHHLSNGHGSLLTCTPISVPYQVSIYVQVSINLFCSFDLFLYPCSNTTLLKQLQPSNQPRRARLQSLVFFFKTVFVSFVSLIFHMNFRVGLLNSLKSLVGIPIGAVVIHRSIINSWGELLELHSYIFQSLYVS